MNQRKLLSGISALSIYLGLIFLILFYYNIHKIKAKNYVDKNSARVTVTLVNSDKTVFNKSSKKTTTSSSSSSIPAPIIPPVPLKRPTNAKPKKHVPKKVVPKKIIKPKKHIPKKVVPKKIIKPKKHVPKKVVPKKIIKPKKHVPKKVVPKKIIKPKKHVPKKVVPKKIIKPKKHVPKKVVPKKVIKPKKHVPKKVVPKKVIKPKKHVPKKVVPKKVIKPKKHVPKKVVPKKVVRPKKVPVKSGRDIFSNIETRKIPKKAPVIHTTQRRPVIHTTQSRPVIHTAPKRPAIVSQRPSIKHSSSVTDRIKNTHLSGRVSNLNRDSGVKNSYIAKVKRHMRNWPATQKGQRISISLTIKSSGHFSYRIISGASGSMASSLRQYLNQLNRMGLGSHEKSTPYNITVNFTT